MNKEPVRICKMPPLAWLVVGSVFISFSPIFIRLADVSPDVAGFYRLLFAVVSLAPVVLLRGRMRRMPRRPTVLLFLCGLFLAIDFMCWHRSIHLVGPGVSTLVANFQVFFTALFAWLLFREKVPGMFGVAVLLAFGGLGLITGVDSDLLSAGYRLGIVFGFMTALFYCGYLLCLKEAMKDATVDGMMAILTLSVAGVLLLGGVALAGGDSFVVPDAKSFLALAGVGVLSTTVGWSVISTAVRHVPATLVGLVLLLQPALAFVWDVLIFARTTGPAEVVGVSLILVAIYIGSAWA